MSEVSLDLPNSLFISELFIICLVKKFSPECQHRLMYTSSNILSMCFLSYYHDTQWNANNSHWKNKSNSFNHYTKNIYLYIYTQKKNEDKKLHTLYWCLITANKHVCKLYIFLMGIIITLFDSTQKEHFSQGL